MATINEAIIAIMGEVGAIGKDRKNQSQGYSFRGIDDAMNALHGLFAKHGVFVTTEVLDQTREERNSTKGGVLIYSILKVRFTFNALDGSKQVCEIIGEGMDSGDKASNKALSVALKYALLQIFLIPTQELIDPEVDSPTPKPRLQPLKPGTFEAAKTTDAAPKSEEKPPTITRWQDITCHVGKQSKGKKLGDISNESRKGLYELFSSKTLTTKEDILLKTALDMWHASLPQVESPKTALDVMLAKCQTEKVDPQALGQALHKRGLVNKPNGFDFSDKEAQYVLDTWKDCMTVLTEELDNLP